MIRIHYRIEQISGNVLKCQHTMHILCDQRFPWWTQYKVIVLKM